MFCSNCGMYNNENSTNCVKCGKELTKNSNNLQSQTGPSVFVAPNNGMPMPTLNNAESNSTSNGSSFQIVEFLFKSLIKPNSTLKDNEDEIGKANQSLVIALLSTIICTFITLIGKIFSTVVVKNCGWLSAGCSISVRLDNLKYIDFLPLIMKLLIIFALIMAGISGIYYLASLVVKKRLNFMRLLSISAVSLIPVILLSNFIGSIIGLLSTELRLFITIISFVYSLTILLTNYSRELNFDDGNMKVYFHTICISIICIISYYVVARIILNSVSSMLSIFS